MHILLPWDRWSMSVEFLIDVAVPDPIEKCAANTTDRLRWIKPEEVVIVPIACIPLSYVESRR